MFFSTRAAVEPIQRNYATTLEFYLRELSVTKRLTLNHRELNMKTIAGTECYGTNGWMMYSLVCCRHC